MLSKNLWMNAFPLTEKAILFIAQRQIYITDYSGVILFESESDFNCQSASTYPTVVVPIVYKGEFYLKSDTGIDKTDIINYSFFRKSSSFRNVDVQDFLMIQKDVLDENGQWVPASSLQQTKQIDQCGYVRSWNGVTLGYQSNSVKILEKDYTMSEIANVSIGGNVYFQAGLTIQNSAHAYLIDVFNRKTYQGAVDVFEYMNLLEVCTLTQFGVGIKDHVLVKYMGREGLGMYLKEREIYQDEWRVKTFSHPKFPTQNLNELLIKAKQEQIDPQKLHLLRFQLRIDCEQQKQKQQEHNVEIEQLMQIIFVKSQQRDMKLKKIEQIIAEILEKVQ